jgi:(4S)-4-hydroxy-5-phosphonooxypentane-2,3-dione isomerase
MLIVNVDVRVKPSDVEAFKQATVENASHSICELGIARFDVLQAEDDAGRFCLVEVYRSPEAATAHKETRHYQAWKEAVVSMMAESRTSTRFANVFPLDEGW